MTDERPSEDSALRRALALVRFTSDPALPGLILMVGLVLVGFLVLALAWSGAAGQIYVPLQIPHVVSGGVGGLALIGLGCALIHIQQGRRDRAAESKLTDELLEHAAALVELEPELRKRFAVRRKTATRARKPGGRRRT